MHIRVYQRWRTRQRKGHNQRDCTNDSVHHARCGTDYGFVSSLGVVSEQSCWRRSVFYHLMLCGRGRHLHRVSTPQEINIYRLLPIVSVELLRTRNFIHHVIYQAVHFLWRRSLNISGGEGVKEAYRCYSLATRVYNNACHATKYAVRRFNQVHVMAL